MLLKTKSLAFKENIIIVCEVLFLITEKSIETVGYFYHSHMLKEVVMFVSYRKFYRYWLSSIILGETILWYVHLCALQVYCTHDFAKKNKHNLIYVKEDAQFISENESHLLTYCYLRKQSLFRLKIYVSERSPNFGSILK